MKWFLSVWLGMFSFFYSSNSGELCIYFKKFMPNKSSARDVSHMSLFFEVRSKMLTQWHSFTQYHSQIYYLNEPIIREKEYHQLETCRDYRWSCIINMSQHWKAAFHTSFNGSCWFIWLTCKQLVKYKVLLCEFRMKKDK